MCYVLPKALSMIASCHTWNELFFLKKSNHAVPHITHKLEGEEWCDKHLVPVSARCYGVVLFKDGATGIKEKWQLYEPLKPIWSWYLWGLWNGNMLTIFPHVMSKYTGIIQIGMGPSIGGSSKDHFWEFKVFFVGSLNILDSLRRNVTRKCLGIFPDCCTLPLPDLLIPRLCLSWIWIQRWTLDF